jgi:hypothetical protein
MNKLNGIRNFLNLISLISESEEEGVNRNCQGVHDHGFIGYIETGDELVLGISCADCAEIRTWRFDGLKNYFIELEKGAREIGLKIRVLVNAYEPLSDKPPTFEKCLRKECGGWGRPYIYPENWKDCMSDIPNFSLEFLPNWEIEKRLKVER